MLLWFADAIATEQKDLGIFDKPVGDRGGNRRVIQNIAPVGKCRIRGNYG